MSQLDIKKLVKECFDEIKNEFVIVEGLLLKKHQNLLLAVSDQTDRKMASNETFRNKSKLSAAGFKWNAGLNSWTIDASQLQKAQETLHAINKSPKEIYIAKIEEIPEFIENADNLSKKDELSQKIESYIDDLSKSVDEVAASAEIKRFLEFNAKFRGYSFHNTMLIYLQNKNATRVAGFRAWQEKFHRAVKKGAKSITIMAPFRKKVDGGESSATDQTSGAIASTPSSPQEPDSGTETPANKYSMRFMAVSVFDIADTEPMDASGEIPETPKWHHDKGESSELADMIFKYASEAAKNLGIDVTQSDANSGENGWAKGDHINISSDNKGVSGAGTIIHEMAHSLLHFKTSSPFYIGDENMNRDVAELQAESVSYVVLRHYGLPVTHEATYLTLWRANSESIKKNLSVIKKVADFIMNEIDKIQEDEEKKNKPVDNPV